MKRKLFFCLLAAGALLAGCDDKGTTGVDSLTMRGSLTLEVGESSSLWATIQPPEAAGRQILYFVEDPTVATYDETTQTVTAITPGTTRIGASAGGKNTVCQVTVLQSSGDVLERIVDDAFREEVRNLMGRSEGFGDPWDANRNGKLSPDEATEVTFLELVDLGITTLEGIENFPALRSLNCANNALTRIDMTKNKALETLQCYGNPIETLNVAGCGRLEALYADFTSETMTTLDASGTSLMSISLGEGHLTSIDLSDCHRLTEVWYSGIGLTSLDVSNCAALTTINCSRTAITRLDLSGCPALANIYITENASLNEIVFDEHTRLGIAYLNDNALTELDLSGCPALTTLNVNGNRLTSLDLLGCQVLYSLECHDNELTELDISGCASLYSLRCQGNRLTELDLSGCPAIGDLSLSGNRLTSIDVSACTDLFYLDCSDNLLTGIDISGNWRMYTLLCEGNPGVGDRLAVAAWFDNNSIPTDRVQGSSYATYNFSRVWLYDNHPVMADYQKVI